MTNKRFLIILALVLVFACAICLVACDNGGGDPTFWNLTLVDENGQEHMSYELPDVTYGSLPNFSFVRLCEKLSDGTVQDVNEKDTEITITWFYRGDRLPDAPSSYKLGHYTVEYAKRSSSVSIHFHVVPSSARSQFVLTINRSSWPYLEPLPTLTVKDVTTDTDLTYETDYSMCYVTDEEYKQLQTANDFDMELNNVRHSYYSREMTPGVYHVFAYVSTGYGYYNSNFVRVEITKATPTFENEELLNAKEYQYDTYNGVIGNIKLSDIMLYDYVSGDDGYYLFAKALAPDGSQIEGRFVWQNPDQEINCNSNDSGRPVVFVPENTDCFTTSGVVTWVTISVLPGRIPMPYVSDSPYLPQYTGEEYAVSMGRGTSIYETYVLALRGGRELAIEIDDGEAIIDRMTNAGTYDYTLQLRDKVNFSWVENDKYYDNDAVTTKEDQRYTFKIEKANSSVYFGNHNLPQLIPDRNGVIRVEIGQFATPHDGALQAEYSATDEEGYNNSSVVADVKIEVVEGKEYLVISNIDWNDHDSYGYLFVRFTAVGTENYKDINFYSQGGIEIYKLPDCELSSFYTYAGFKPYSLYNHRNYMTTTIGRWQLYLQNGSDWQIVTEELTLSTADTYNFKAVFETDQLDENPADKLFTITTEDIPECPLQAGTVIEVPADTNVAEWLLQNKGITIAFGENGWTLQEKDVWGEWTTWGNDRGFSVPGQHTLRLVYFQGYNANDDVHGWYYNPDFGVEITIVVTAQAD